jgi:ribosomal protein L18E|tara:strand:+ start:337 stop:714 length:378 start_codon:yes stop_codon:yes gene_type:complete
MNNVSRLPEPTATINLTSTMLDKSIIDANATVRRFAFSNGVDFTKLEKGGSNGVVIEARHFDGQECKIKFYLTKRGDRRVSISKLKTIAGHGDTVAITVLDGVVVINLTKVDENAFNTFMEAGKL